MWHRSHQNENETDGSSKSAGSGKLSDLTSAHHPHHHRYRHHHSSSSKWLEIEAVKRRKVEALELMKGVVRSLAEGKEEEVVIAAAGEIKRLAKNDLFARKTLAMLGAISPLIEILDCDNDHTKVASLYALLNLAIRNDLNKVAIVKAEAVHRMLNIITMAAGNDPISLLKKCTAHLK
ncbi:unnamed protein product [Rhodiola kirilowii]